MYYKTFTFYTLILAVATLTSCSHKLVGNWNIEKYETTTPGKQGVTLTNIGTLSFQKDGNGTKDIAYSILGQKIEYNSSFSWSTTDEFVTLDSENSDFSKTWIQVENKKKSTKMESYRWRQSGTSNRT